MFLAAIIVALSFFELSGVAGHIIKTGLLFLIGKTVFAVPLILLISGLVFFSTRYKKFFYSLLLAIFILILGISGMLECLGSGLRTGGWLGYFMVLPFLKLFDLWVTKIIFAAIIFIGGLIFWHLLRQPRDARFKEKLIQESPLAEERPKQSLIKKIFAPRFKVKEIPTAVNGIHRPEKIIAATPELKSKLVPAQAPAFPYQIPPTDLLETEKGAPSPGDTRTNAAIIKKTLQNFDIPVEMSEINVGPTVTQYSLKPAEGVKLSKITALNNDLALALASHPIRIEAPIPGKSLVGIEVPNKVRAQVRLRDLIESENFQKSPFSLNIVLGRDVSGNSVYADLARMPHMLVAGSTGTGKTIFLNDFILSLLYRNSPEILRFILIDPKRVEFTAYNDLPHLLCPVIYDANRTINALRWLISEMERRFDVLSASKTRNIASHNAQVTERGDENKSSSSPFAVARVTEVLPYIVLIVDELADLMAAKGREVEAGVVRLAQMSRAVGIHLVVATQRPSVEVITGLIKANITSRITFQVASQVDSRTVLDMAGAEKLLGLGDMLYLSAEIGKPRRIQAAYVSEKEVRKVVSWLKTQNAKLKTEKLDEGILENALAKDLEQAIELPAGGEREFYGKEDPLYEEAKRVVIEARKASASLLQRRLRLGYARAARLLDMLEQSGVVGPGDGAKPREVYPARDYRGEEEAPRKQISNGVYFKPEKPEETKGAEEKEKNENNENNEENGWRKV